MKLKFIYLGLIFVFYLRNVNSSSIQSNFQKNLTTIEKNVPKLN